MDQLNLGLAGGDDFTDVAHIFYNAAAEMMPGQMVFMDGFTLEDAMSVFEIGEPRLDSGFVPPGEVRREFEPLQPLLPEEVCWILDRAFACEMEWHSGNMLAQTVFTFLFVHHLAVVEPDAVPMRMPQSQAEFARPIELITVVVRAAVWGMLKCCDLSWRELSKGNVYDGEDWQGDKCDVSLLENTTVRQCLALLDEAMYWISNTHRIPVQWRDALYSRLLMRKYLLQMMDANVYRHPSQFKSLASMCREQLRLVRAFPSPAPSPESPAHAVLDPAVSRRLNTFVPIRIHELPPQEQTWKTMSSLVDGWSDIYRLSVTTDVLSWEIDGVTTSWLPSVPPKLPYIRSYIQSVFYDGVLVLNRFTPNWLVNRFSIEIIGMPYDAFVTNVKQRWTRRQPPLLTNLEDMFSDLLVKHVRCHWFNPPRKRRYMMQSLPAWHAIYDQILSIVSRLRPPDDSLAGEHVPATWDALVDRTPCAVLMWRTQVVRDVILSGFQLALYSVNEIPMAYWYLVRVIDTILTCVDSLKSVSACHDSVVSLELGYTHVLSSATQLLCMALFSLTIRQSTIPLSMQRSSFDLRHKWAFDAAYAQVATPQVNLPRFEDYQADLEDILADKDFSPRETVLHAKALYALLLEGDHAGGWAGHARHHRRAVLKMLHGACTLLEDIPSTVEDITKLDRTRLKWDPSANPWFPALVPQEAPVGTSIEDVQVPDPVNPC